MFNSHLSIDYNKVLLRIHSIEPPPTNRQLEWIESFENEQPQSFQFDFNIDEMDNETTIDVGMKPLNGDLQQQNLTPDQLEQLFCRASAKLVAEWTRVFLNVKQQSKYHFHLHRQIVKKI